MCVWWLQECPPSSLIPPKLMEHSADGFRGFGILALSGFTKNPSLHCPLSSFPALQFPKEFGNFFPARVIYSMFGIFLLPILPSLPSSLFLSHSRRFFSIPLHLQDQIRLPPWQSLLWIFAHSPAQFSSSLSCVFRIKTQLVQFFMLITH